LTGKTPVAANERNSPMAFSIQTNVNALVAQENLRINSDFQSRTIQRLTSGYRINSSGDDAAGLAIANGFRADTQELTQGVRNSNDGISQLQIIDSGLNNIAKMLDRMKTLATQSASSTFTGDRGLLQSEYGKLVNEIDRQAANIGLGGAAGTDAGRFVQTLGVYIGGASKTQANASITIDLSSGQVDSSTLGLNTSMISGSISATTIGSVNLNSGTWLVNSTQEFRISTADVDKSFTVGGGASGLSKDQFLQALNVQLAGTGVTASTTAGGILQLTSKSGFVFDAKASSGTGNQAVTTGTNEKSTIRLDAGLVTDYDEDAGDDSRTFTFTVNGSELTNKVILSDTGTSVDDIFLAFRNALNDTGVDVIRQGDHMYLQSDMHFSVDTDFVDGAASSDGGPASIMADGIHTAGGEVPAAVDVTGNAKAALTAIGTALESLGKVQGTVGSGQNMLNYAVSLAQSQISNFSAAESRIRDADVASEAANLTKAQVLQQASIAAMAQANSAPQAVLSLLKG
jgi:flagellin